VFASSSIREGFGITYAEAIAADCTVIAADHPSSAASEVIGKAGYLVEPTVSGVAAALDEALSGRRPAVSPTELQQSSTASISRTRLRECNAKRSNGLEGLTSRRIGPHNCVHDREY
jgi:glycosyltransferase involved in cell wall biosynthesis